MRKFATSVIASALFALAAPAFAKSPGHFLYSGPTDADADVLSIKWRFGFQFTIPPETISSVAFSCGSIPSTAVTVNAADLKVDAQGIAFAESPTVAVSKETTSWLFDSSTTNATCEAIVTTVKNKQLRETVPVSFAPNVKTTLLMQLDMAFKYNKSLKSK